ncbi:MAG: nucleotidyl transferase AbiEii/AbiGii toxin family protein [Desulfobacterales bacterium]
MKKYGAIKPVRGIEDNRILTHWQKKFLRAFADSDLKNMFRLSGGTALSAFYLEHRLSFDLDFFSYEAVPSPLIEHFLNHLDFAEKTQMQKAYDRKIYTMQVTDGSRIKTEFTLYPRKNIFPFELSDKVPIDSFTDLTVNKLCALADRNDIKDYVDLYAVCRDRPGFLQRMLDYAEKKCEMHGLRHIVKYKLLQIPQGVEELYLKKEIDRKEMESFFRAVVKKMVEMEVNGNMLNDK